MHTRCCPRLPRVTTIRVRPSASGAVLSATAALAFLLLGSTYAWGGALDQLPPSKDYCVVGAGPGGLQLGYELRASQRDTGLLTQGGRSIRGDRAAPLARRFQGLQSTSHWIRMGSDGS